MISVQAWKHWVLAGLGLLLGLGVIAASHTHSQWAGQLGPGLPKLLKLSTSPILAWSHTLILFLSAQLACVILWARSRSLRDFGGQYRIWGWAAATWLLLSFSVATRAHQAWSETILHHFPWRAPGAALWCWLVPASIWGWALALRLEQDMREDPAGYWGLLVAGLFQCACVATLLQSEFWSASIPTDLQQVLFSVFQLLANIMLLLSMSLHTRFVLYYSAEPPLGRRRSTSTRRVDLSPAPHGMFQRLLPNWLTGVKMPQGGEEESIGDEESSRGRKRAAPKKKSTARKTPRRPKTAVAADDEAADGGTVELGDEAVEAGSAKKSYRVDKP